MNPSRTRFPGGLEQISSALGMMIQTPPRVFPANPTFALSYEQSFCSLAPGLKRSISREANHMRFTARTPYPIIQCRCQWCYTESLI
jgi:hypothetical protein